MPIKKIAVLQPRRDNAIQLSHRVAHETNTVWGERVGYSIGLGVHNSTDETEIEYLTHGKFLQLAKKPSNVFNSYKAVIIDEAHVRSLQIDFVIALLREVLKNLNTSRSKCNDTTFKLIITTATFDPTFTEKLIPYFSAVATVASLSFDIPSYPVYKKYIDVFDGKYTDALADIPFDMFSNGIINAGIQICFDLLRNTDSGNILCFLPSRAAVETAVSVFEDKLRDGLSSKDDDDDDGQVKPKTRSSKFEFAFTLNSKTKKKTQSAAVFGFHGKLTRTQRHSVCQADYDRIVFFATDLAETGLTLANIRYVVDSGFSQSVTWKGVANTQEMNKELICKASAIQRAGRAGRVASGIYFALFPASVFDSMRESFRPEISSGDVLKSVLNYWSLSSNQSSPLELVDDFDPGLYSNSIEILKKVSAIEEQDGDTFSVTEKGNLLLKFGVSFDRGLFLISAANFKCLGSAAKLVSLWSVEAEIIFQNLDQYFKPRYLKYVHDRGTNSTLLNIFNGYLSQKDDKSKRKWCDHNGVSVDIMFDAETAFMSIQEKLLDLGFACQDEFDHLSTNAHDVLAKAQLSAFFNNVGALKVLGNPTAGLILLTDDGIANISSGPVADDDDSDNVAKISSESRALLNQIPNQNQDFSFAIFSSRMNISRFDVQSQTQISVPTVSFVSLCSRDDILSSVPSWQLELVEKQMMKRERSRFSVDISDTHRSTLLNNIGFQLRKLRESNRRANIDLVGDKRSGTKLVVSCPRPLLDTIRTRIEGFLTDLEPETIEFTDLEGVDFGKLIGRGGSNRDKINKQLNSVIESVAKPSPVVSLKVDSKKRSIKVEIPSEVGYDLISVVMGLLQSHILSCSNNLSLDLSNYESSAKFTTHVNQNPRLLKLTSTQPLF
ncbi:hypothetical protein GEMRC1_007530 [Eukaryota sp. GEM-RC1]